MFRKVFYNLCCILVSVCSIGIFVTELHAMREFALRLDHSNPKRACLVDKVSDVEVVVTDVLKKWHMESCRDIPLNESENKAYLELYQTTDTDTLEYGSSFWMPVTRTSVELMFCCLDGRQVPVFEDKIRPFLDFVRESGNFLFKAKVFKKYFTEWRTTIVDIEESAKFYGVPSDVLYIDNVRVTLNSLLDAIDSKRTIIKWRF